MAVTLERRDNIAVVTIDRPEVLNALDSRAYAQLSQTWTEVRDNPDIWACVVTGAGDRAFCVGRDLKEAAATEGEGASWHFWQTQHDQLINHGLQLWKPVIAAVNGYCLGAGLTLMLATDVRVAVPHATFGLTEVQRGLLPNNGGTQRLLRQLPYAVAMEMLLTGDPTDAPLALQHGLINRVVPADRLLDEALAIADRLCRNAPLALRAIKELAVRSQHLSSDDGLRMEDAMARILRSTNDAVEGPAAFAERRPARFTGN